MSNPLSGNPDPEATRPVRRRFQPSPVKEALGEMKEALQARLRRIQPTLRSMQSGAKDAGRRARRYGQDLWFRGKRSPRKFGLAAGAVALSLVGAYAVSASMGGSLCPSATPGKAPKFLVLMDSVPQIATGSKLEIQYEVCGLAAGTPYRGKVRLVQQQQRLAGKKKSYQPKPTVVSFKGRSDGVATRRQQPVSVALARPGTYTLELVVADGKGRERKRTQQVVVRAR